MTTMSTMPTFNIFMFLLPVLPRSAGVMLHHRQTGCEKFVLKPTFSEY
jgi:hypothetical protein